VQKLIAVDGTNLAYRSFFALKNSDLRHAGRPVWAVHGLLLQIAKVLVEERPSHLVVAFDTPGGCAHRLALDPGYKSSRTRPVEELAVQLSWAPSVLRQIGISVLDGSGWEADDFLASAVVAAGTNGMASVVFTSDRDAYQLVSDRCTVRTPDGKVVDKAALHHLYGTDAAGYQMIAALRGEPSDNLPGVTGVGDKTAARLAARFSSLDALDAATDEELRAVVGPKVVAALRSEIDRARLTFAVACLRHDLPVDLSEASLALVDPRVTTRLGQVGLSRAGERLGAALGSLSGPDAR
jgi:DNA polymerase-1